MGIDKNKNITMSAPSSTGVMVMGIIALAVKLVSVIMYLVVDDLSGFKAFHGTYISMAWSTLSPFAFAWLINMFDDSKQSRDNISTALGAAGSGVMGLMWVGWLGFVMAADGAKKFNFTTGTDNSMNVIFSIIYGVVNIAMVIVYWLLAPGIQKFADAEPAKKVVAAAVAKVEEKKEAKKEEAAEEEAEEEGGLAF